jgi:hypothetical protein
LTAITNLAFAQASTGGIDGTVTNKKGETVPLASIGAFEGGILKGQGKSNFNGNFKIKPLPPGTYTLKISSVGYDKMEITGIVVRSNNMTTQNAVMQIRNSGKGKVTKTLVIKSGPKIIDPTDPGGSEVTGKQLEDMATTNISKGLELVTGVDNGGSSGGAVQIGGGRGDETLYLIDGMQVRGSEMINSIPPALLRGLKVFKSGVPAKVGNATGGVIEVNTINMSSKLRGGLRGQHSFDGFNNNFLNFNLSGPLAFKTDSSAAVARRPVLGFVLSLSGRYNKDPNPSYNGYTTLTPEALSRVQQNPLTTNPLGSGTSLFLPTAETVNANDFRTTRARENGENYSFNYLGKLDFAPTSRMNLRLGTYFNYGRSKGWSFANSMFAPEANSINNSYTARGFLQMQQSLGRPDADNEDALISNAFYNVQLSYQRAFGQSENPNHGDDIFRYGYLGRFNQESSPFYINEKFNGPSGAEYEGWRYVGDAFTGLTYTPSGDNPLLENYTNQVMNDSRLNINNLFSLVAFQGLRNGDAPSNAYGLWTGPGSQISSYGYSQSDQFDLNLGASFDINQGIKNKENKDAITHQIEFGLGYQQITSRGYSVGANRLGNLWTLMRLITNNHVQNLDEDNPIFVVGGNNYTEQQLLDAGLEFSEFDTVQYNRFLAASDITRFSKELRTKLFGDPNNTDIINIDNLGPETFSLDMFSADDLFNDGNNIFTNYNGYDYLGNIQRNQPNFRDFWTKRDDRGDLLRPIAPYNPNYMFGYISDLFKYKDVVFNVGVRIDRFDANQNVLRDPYSLYGVQKLSGINSNQYRLAKDPSTNVVAPDPKAAGFDTDWVPYVDNNQASTPTLVGYRSGDVWYDPFGKEIADPTILSEDYANGLPIQPWLTDVTDSIKSEGYNIDNAFTDYAPDIAVSPRIRFTFPISDEALFFGNYDIMTQYPQGNNFVTPDDYYFFTDRTGALNNANLRMQRTINYRLGFEQGLTKNSKIGIEAYYNERKGQVQLQQFVLAYPRTYTSYGNRDFSSTKGFTFNYKLQGTRKLPLRMSIAYTLQFAEGTGSNSASMSSLINQGQPNLRTVFPMSFDTRHIGSMNIDYNFGNIRKGPKIGKDDNVHYLLNGVSMNLLLNARSGRPYTKRARAVAINQTATNIPIIGKFNGSRRPWTSNMDFRINKNLTFARIGRKKDDQGEIIKNSGKRLSGSVFVYFENLLNTRNVVGLYSYSGEPDDDGYLASPQGQQELNTEIIFDQSYIDLYNTRINSPFNFNNPRRAYVGFSMNF